MKRPIFMSIFAVAITLKIGVGAAPFLTYECIKAE